MITIILLKGKARNGHSGVDTTPTHERIDRCAYRQAFLMIVDIAVYLSTVHTYKCQTLSFHAFSKDVKMRNLCLLKYNFGL